MGRSLHCNHAGFNPRTHTGCDLHWYEAEYVGYVFQSTHPHGVRHFLRHLLCYCLSFNPRTHTGCDIYDFIKTNFDNWFQSTHPHGVRQGNDPMALAAMMFQSTHPHGVRLRALLRPDELPRVSIHAPTRGATALAFYQPEHRTVSIHAPTRGATVATLANVPYVMFQSTHPHGVRPCRTGQSRQRSSVSIHAPTRGAT